jgi:hypothetical protein
MNPKLIEIIFENPIRTSKKTQHVSSTTVSWLIVFKKIIATYMTAIQNRKYQIQNHWLWKQAAHHSVLKD